MPKRGSQPQLQLPASFSADFIEQNVVALCDSVENIASALTHSSRVAMLRRITRLDRHRRSSPEGQTLENAATLATKLEQSGSLVATSFDKHLAGLEKAELVTGKKRGRDVFYTRGMEGITNALRLLAVCFGLTAKESAAAFRILSPDEFKASRIQAENLYVQLGGSARCVFIFRQLILGNKISSELVKLCKDLYGMEQDDTSKYLQIMLQPGLIKALERHQHGRVYAVGYDKAELILAIRHFFTIVNA